MGIQKTKWTQQEEEALRAGVQKHGMGKWKNILKDPDFGPSLTIRSNIDLKDKWRNMIISLDRSKVLKPKPLRIGANGAHTSEVAEVDAGDDPSKSLPEGQTAPRYSELIFDAISSINDSNGCDYGAIVEFIEQRHEVSQNFRRLLSVKLRRLLLQGKLEKVKNCYKIKDATLGTQTPMPRQKDVRPRQPPNSRPAVPIEAVEDAAKTAAHKIAEAENKSFVASEAVKEAEKVVRMAEETELVLILINNVRQLCSRGGIVIMA